MQPEGFCPFLLDAGAPVRLIARDPSRLSLEIRDRTEVIEGSHSDTRVVNTAFEGADAVFWLLPPDPGAKSVEAAYVDFTLSACEAFKTHGIDRVVGISALGGVM